MPAHTPAEAGWEAGVECDGEGKGRRRRATPPIDHARTHLDFLHRVVVINAQVHVVRARDDPLLAHHELGAPHGHLAHLKALDEQLGWAGDGWGGTYGKSQHGWQPCPSLPSKMVTYAGGVVVNHAVTGVERRQHPRLLRGEEVHRFDPLAPGGAFLLYFQSQRHQEIWWCGLQPDVRSLTLPFTCGDAGTLQVRSQRDFLERQAMLTCFALSRLRCQVRPLFEEDKRKGSRHICANS